MGDAEIDTLLAKLAATPRRRTPLHLLGTKRFELRRQLGSGAFGDVYEAWDREHGTPVALKSLKSSNPDWIYRFKREFRIVGDLAHPNLVRLYELFVEEDRWYLTMELVQGLRLDDHLRRDPAQLRSCFAQLALGILELHRAGCLHRDLKPSNALVEATGRAVLLDFGLAVHQRATRASALAGTPPYMAPELGLGQPPSEASDWYAFGVMLYEALAGELPFTGSEVEMLQRKLGDPPVPPSLLRPHVDPGLEALALQLLHKDPLDRPSSAGVLAELVGADHAQLEVARRQAPQPPLVGRRDELARLEACLDASATGPVVCAVRGVPGMGKTSLVTAFLERLRERRVQQCSGRCLELESVPFKGVDGAIDMLCNDLRRLPPDVVRRLVPADADALAQMFPMLKRVEAFAHARPGQARSPHETRRAASSALRELIRGLCAGERLVIFVDDLQWTSDDSVRLLLELMAPPAPPLLLIVAHRHEDEGSSPLVERFLEGLAGHGVTPEIVELAPLDATSIDEWITTHADRAVNSEEALRETGGHPYLLSRLLQHGSHGAAQPLDLSAVLATELGQLDPDARRLLELVAIAGGPISQRTAFEAAGLRRDPATVDQLRRRRLIHGSTAIADAPLEAYHDRVREIALASLPAERRRELHRDVAAALETSGIAEPETLARHYREARDLTRAILWTRRAARHATASLAFARAVELYEEATLVATDDALRLDLFEELAEALVQCGRRNDAGVTCLEAAELARQLGDANRHAALCARAGEHFLLGGSLETGLDLLRGSLAAVGVSLPVSPAVAVAESFNVGGALATRGLEFRPRDAAEIDPRLLHRIDLQLGVARALTLTDLRGPLMAARGLADALEAGEPQRVQRALAYFVINHVSRMPNDALVVEAEARAFELAEHQTDLVGLAWAQLASGFHAVYRHDFVVAVAEFAEAERRFLASPAHAREATLARLAIVMVCGNYCLDIPYARRRHAGCTDEALARGDVFGATWSRFVQSLLDLAIGAPAAAREDLAAVRTTWPRAVDSLLSASVVLNEISIDLHETPDTAWETVVRLEPEFRRLFSSLLPFTRYAWGRLVANSAMGAHAGGRATRAETIARIEAVREGMDAPIHHGGVFVVDGHLRLLAGDLAGSLEAREAAVAAWLESHQATFAETARLRIHQFRGDDAGARASIAELRRLGVGVPDRFAHVFAGPLPPR